MARALDSRSDRGPVGPANGGTNFFVLVHREKADLVEARMNARMARGKTDASEIVGSGHHWAEDPRELTYMAAGEMIAQSPGIQIDSLNDYISFHHQVLPVVAADRRVGEVQRVPAPPLRIKPIKQFIGGASSRSERLSRLTLVLSLASRKNLAYVWLKLIGGALAVSKALSWLIGLVINLLK